MRVNRSGLVAFTVGAVLLAGCGSARDVGAASNAIHAAGYVDPASAAFHGPDAIRFLSNQPGATDCRGCHAADLSGAFGPSCNDCHAAAGFADWRNNCNFCHTAPPATGKHPTTFAPHASLATNCAVCHLGVVDTQLNVIDATRHLNGVVDVRLVAGSFAAGTCSNVACHGPSPAPVPW